ncbi:transcription factor grauzone-like [Bradysia coprophila]|uniref:transcription factor grauzone-like n=1 Tax=Bradysia coprophila TaxID=38358 RepID=UPI00187DCA80|nr:transcription factor grauzone-like [Bradysia coprophila]
MDLNSTQLCRLCVEASADLVKVSEKFQDVTIASILSKHFWFLANENDCMSDWLCQICWIQTKTFHDFYKKVEIRHGHYCRSNDMANNSLIKQEPRLERNNCPRDESLDLDLNLVKYEETEPSTQATDITISKEENWECNNYNDDKSCDENDDKSSVSDEEHPSIKSKNEKARDDSKARNVRQPSKIAGKTCNWHSRTDKEKQDAQIRELFSMKCELCTDDDVVFETLLRARQHYRSVHKISGYLTCCGKKFHRRHLVLNHIRNHVDPDAYRCDQCGKRFQNKFRLRNHIDNHVPLDSRAHKCSLCSSSFGRESLLRLHMKSKHESKTGEKFPCEKCGKNFRSSLLLSCHIRGVHEFSLEHVCEICARVFKTKQILQNHIFCEHSTTPKVQCNVCGAWLKHEISLRAHLKRYHDSSFESVNCPICNKEVPSKHSLAGHIRSVHGEKDHQCTFCNKAFQTAKKLKEHIACHTGEDLYECPYCDKKFRSSGNLYAHRKKAHLAEWSRDKANTSTEQSILGAETTSKLEAGDQ